MNWSLSIGTIGGTSIRLHWSFLLFLLWIGRALWTQGGPGAALGGVAFFALLFACVVLHEFGHILAARRFGVRTPEILLLPIGGVSRLERIPEPPREELLIALAGPAVSLSIGLALVLALGGLPAFDEALSEPGAALAARLAWANLFLGAFNLIPAFPMDGGRVLRALLATRLGYARSTRIAAGAGQLVALLFGVAGLMTGNVVLMLIAPFVYVAAGSEAGVAQLRSATLGLVVADVAMTDLERLPADAPVSAAADALIRTDQRDFPAVDGQGRLRGVLTRDGIVKALRRGGPDALVNEAMQAGVPALSPRHGAEVAVRLLQQGAPAVAVEDADGGFVGLVTWDNLLEHMLVARAWGLSEDRTPRAEGRVPLTARHGGGRARA